MAGPFECGRGALDWAYLVAASAYGVAALLAVRRAPFARRLLALAYATLLCMLACEPLLGPLLPATVTGPWPRVRWDREAADTMPGVQGRLQFTTNALGLRGPDVRLEEMDLKVLCVGASTTECLYVTDRMSWPWHAGEELSRALGVRVFFGNAGRSGRFTRHHEYLLRHYPRASEFDWVVVLVGAADVGLLLRDNYDERLSRVPVEALGYSDPPGALYRRLAFSRGLRLMVGGFRTEGLVHQDLAGQWYAGARRARLEMLARNTITIPPADLPPALARYRADVKRVVAAARLRGLRVVLMTQPTLWREGLAPRFQALLHEHTDAGAYSVDVLAGVMKAFNGVLLEVCRDEGLDCIDLWREFEAAPEGFYDDFHFNVEGSRRVSRAVTRFFRERVGRSAP